MLDDKQMQRCFRKYSTAATIVVNLLSWALISAPLRGQSVTNIRPFKVNIPEEALVDLRRRIAATRWPDKETVPDQSQGAQLAKLQELVRYWGTGYDWRKAEAKLNSYQQFVTNIDGLDIQFIHVKSKEKNAMPLIIKHGWPGSVLLMVGSTVRVRPS